MRGSENGQRARLTLLIADDDPVVRSMLSMGLEQRFEIVAAVEDAAEAVEAAAAQETIAQLRADLNPEMRERVLETFEQSLREGVRAIEDALRSGDEQTLARILHKLKGGSATIGAHELSKGCQELRLRLGADRPNLTGGLADLTAIADRTVAQLRERLLEGQSTSRRAA